MAVTKSVVGTPGTPQFLEVLWRGQVSLTPGGTRSIVQVYHFNQLALVPIAEDGISLLDDLFSKLDGALKAALSIDYAGLDVRGRFMDDPTSAEFVSMSTPSPGQVTGDRLPIFNAATIQIRSSARGRSYRGSKHFAPVAESSTTEDALNMTGLGLWGSVATQLQNLTLTGANGSSWQLIVLSRVLSDLTANPSVFTFASEQPGAGGAVLNTKIGTMRRRKRSVT